MGAQDIDGHAMLARVRELLGGRELIDLAAGREDVELVGGAVRDLALGRAPRELDVVVGHEAHAFARELAARLDTLAGESPGKEAEATVHERFRTALVHWNAGETMARIDIATRRSERYPAPGALPEVAEGTPEQDLERRDFTVNAIALSLDGAQRGEVRAVGHACEDLAAGLLRVLHDRSFLDDPTRLLRLARYRARLGFAIEEHTVRLAAAAVAQDALATVSRARVGAELRLALGEADAVAALTALDDLGVLAALHPRLHFDAELARDALALLALAEGDTGPELRPDLLLVAVALQSLAADILAEGVERDLYTLLDGWEFPAVERDLVLRAAIAAEALADELGYAEGGSEIYEAVSGKPLEGVALAGAWAGPLSNAGFAADSWLSELHSVRLLITGEDLLAAGIPEGPEIGRRLEAALARKLDGELADDRGAELRAALEA
jgi:tRNA nucleotidyltransferase (CCA-adding enzyme)